MDKSDNFSGLTAPDYGVCRDMLRKSIDDTNITYWNIALVAPNVLFVIFIVYHIGLFSRIFVQQQFPVVKALLVLVFLVCVISIFRGFLATIIKTVKPDDHIPNEIQWLLMRFLLLAVEISVIGFGLFGMVAFYNSKGYGSNSGVGKRVISLSFFIALVYTTIQTILEFTQEDHAKIFKHKYMMFHHGGMLFWCVSSSLFFLIYSAIVILPKANCLCARGFLSLPSNRAFYRYAAMLCVVNLLQSVGSLMVYKKVTVGLCILNASVLLYYSLYAPLVYFVFLRKSFTYLKSPYTDLDESASRESSSSDSQTNHETNSIGVV